MPLEKCFYLFQYCCITLTPQSAQDYSEKLCIFCLLDLLISYSFHLFSGVYLMGKLLLEWIILVEGEVGIPYHAGLDMEPPISNENDYFSTF